MPYTEIKGDKGLRVEIRTVDVTTHAAMTNPERWTFLVDGVRDLLNRIAVEVEDGKRG